MPNLKFTTLDVFTSVPYYGNPLAIVHVPASVTLTSAQKRLIAREFNLSETVFLHEPLNEQETVVTIDIFTTTAELPFAGHPTVGTGWYLLSKSPPTLLTKAGHIKVTPGSTTGSVGVQIPVDFKVHPSYYHPRVKPNQPRLQSKDYVNSSTGAEPLVSIVKGMTFMMLQLTSEDALSRLQPFVEPVTLPEGYLGEWKGFVGVYAFVELENGTVKTRMFHGTMEDPATGSAASALGGWLAKSKGQGEWIVDIMQGVDMGRKSEISVRVVVDDGEVERITLEGKAVVVMEGSLYI